MSTATRLAREAIPNRSESATLVVSVADDPRSSAADLAGAVGTDAALASRVLALANSAYYGLSGRIGRLDLAMSILGFNTVRALALTAAVGLDRAESVPSGFWDQAATAATAANALAPVFNANGQDAFCLGLLHTMGSALLHQVAPLPALCLAQLDDSGALLRTEFELYETDHAEAGAEVLRVWHFPEPLCTLIANHHAEPLPDSDPLVRVLHTARTFTYLVLSGAAVEPFRDGIARVSEGRITGDSLERWMEQIAKRAVALREGLASR